MNKEDILHDLAFDASRKVNWTEYGFFKETDKEICHQIALDVLEASYDSMRRELAIQGIRNVVKARLKTHFTNTIPSDALDKIISDMQLQFDLLVRQALVEY